MKPFLLLQIRPLDVASDNEYLAFLKYGNLKADEVHRLRIEKTGIPVINLDDYSGIIVGGGPANVSDEHAKKSVEQLKYETDLITLFDDIIENDFPFLGACYGIGILTYYLKCNVSKEKYSEEPGIIDIKLSEVAENDPLTKGLPQKFYALGGHKESCMELPKNATLLASSDDCPIQMIRVKNNIYATQFHPELDQNGFALRVNIYKDAGYFPPDDVEKLIQQASAYNITVPQIILQRFVERYRQ